MPPSSLSDWAWIAASGAGEPASSFLTIAGLVDPDFVSRAARTCVIRPALVIQPLVEMSWYQSGVPVRETSTIHGSSWTP